MATVMGVFIPPPQMLAISRNRQYSTELFAEEENSKQPSAHLQYEFATTHGNTLHLPHRSMSSTETIR
ncbi:hypothetical protein [Nostoc sp. FACHB-280]|uniref:hypothetical protein n=1 Tax=Nostoc sp. FACHB-280 TaxID=2692839 RepID=UPI00168A59F2|nr:hypothetical protein [Nostoc sp. FACHB-280]MBD2497253.1 hypothetical protein [Nostoc sp. FACHB-280]